MIWDGQTWDTTVPNTTKPQISTDWRRRSWSSTAPIPAPSCSPSRACLFTGLNAAHTKIYHVDGFYRVKPDKFKVGPPKSGHHYEKPIEMLGNALKQAGYQTGYVGKWHVTKDPTKNGFDFNAGGWFRGDPPSYFSPYRNKSLEDGPKGEYLPDRLANESIGFIRKNRDKPFFLVYAPYSVHYPNQAREEDIKRFKSRTKEDERQLPVYAAMVYAMDRAVQTVLDALEQENVADNTLIVFTSDNGANGRSALSGPLRGSKGPSTKAARVFRRWCTGRGIPLHESPMRSSTSLTGIRPFWIPPVQPSQSIPSMANRSSPC